MHRRWVGRCLCLMIFMLLSGCAGVQTFPNVVRSGETVAIAAGWKQNFTNENITVRIISSSGQEVTYQPLDPAIRAVVNLYPDPVSALLVSDAINKDIVPNMLTYATQIHNNFTGEDRDWWQTTVFVDLPRAISIGVATIEISNPYGEMATAVVEVVGGEGVPAAFNAEKNGNLASSQLSALGRAHHYVVGFDGVRVPYAVEVIMGYQFGDLHLVNPRGDLKNVAWVDDGESIIRAVITPASSKVPLNMTDYKFYVAGGLAGFTTLQVLNVKAYDADGLEIAGVVASINEMQ